MTRYTISINSDLKVVGYDGEFADFDNPQGAIVREVFHLSATTARGDRKAFGAFDSFEAAEAAIPFAPMVEAWGEDYPVYGSEAYQDSDTEAEWAAWERDHDGPVYGLRATYQPSLEGGL